VDSHRGDARRVFVVKHPKRGWSVGVAQVRRRERLRKRAHAWPKNKKKAVESRIGLKG